MDVEIGIAVWEKLQNSSLVQRGLSIVPDYSLPLETPAMIANDTDLSVIYFLPSYFDRLGELEKAWASAYAVRHEAAHSIYDSLSEETVSHLAWNLISDDEIFGIIRNVLDERQRRRSEAWRNLAIASGIGALATSPIWMPPLMKWLARRV